jgi:hypothetical protein
MRAFYFAWQDETRIVPQAVGQLAQLIRDRKVTKSIIFHHA